MALAFDAAVAFDSALYTFDGAAAGTSVITTGIGTQRVTLRTDARLALRTDQRATINED